MVLTIEQRRSYLLVRARPAKFSKHYRSECGLRHNLDYKSDVGGRAQSLVTANAERGKSVYFLWRRVNIVLSAVLFRTFFSF